MHKRTRVLDMENDHLDVPTLSTEEDSEASGDSKQKNNSLLLGWVPFRDDQYLVTENGKTAVLGSGGFGLVCRMINMKDNVSYAVKRISFKDGDDAYYRLQFMREIYMCSYVADHPNIVKVLHSSIGPDYGCLVMPLYKQDLSKFISTNSPKTPRTMKFMKQLSSAVAHLHRLNIFHRDIKPSNIMVDASGETVVLCDFNSASTYVKGRTYTRPIVTIWYRPPEILCDIPPQYDMAVDIWSLGCVLGELMVGKVLFPGGCEIDMLFKIMRLMGTPKTSLYFSKEELEIFPRFPVGFRVPRKTADEPHPGKLLNILKWMLQFHSKDRPKASKLEKLFNVYHE